MPRDSQGRIPQPAPRTMVDLLRFTDSPEVGTESLDSATHGLVGLLDVSGGELPDDAQARSALDERQDAMPLVGADDRVAFPMAKLESSLNDRRSFANMPLAEESAAR